MTYTTLKTTAAVIALTAGTAWAGDYDKADTKMETGSEAVQDADLKENREATAELDTQIEGATDEMQAEVDDIDVRRPANAEMTERSEEMQAANDMAAQEVETLDNAQMGNSTMVPGSGVGVASASDFDGMTVADLVGMDVEGANGEDVGEIDYIFKDGDEYAAIVGVGGFLGLGEHDVAVPLSDFEFSEDDEVVLSNWDEEKLKAQPDMDESEITALEDGMRIEVSS